MYKITIEKITKTEYPETKTWYTDKKTGETNTSRYDMGEYSEADEKTGQILIRTDDEKTGQILIRTDEEKIYEQTTEKEIDLKKVIDSFNQ